MICGPHLAKNQAEFDAIREIGGVTDIANGDELADAVKAGILTDKEKQISESAMKSYAERAGKRPTIAADYTLSCCMTGQHHNDQDTIILEQQGCHLDAASALSGLWKLVGTVRRFFAQQSRADLPVICIGNLTVGGTGKTPVVAYS